MYYGMMLYEHLQDLKDYSQKREWRVVDFDMEEVERRVNIIKESCGVDLSKPLSELREVVKRKEVFGIKDKVWKMIFSLSEE